MLKALMKSLNSLRIWERKTESTEDCKLVERRTDDCKCKQRY